MVKGGNLVFKMAGKIYTHIQYQYFYPKSNCLVCHCLINLTRVVIELLIKPQNISK
jgi:hypothetical protein